MFIGFETVRNQIKTIPKVNVHRALLRGITLKKMYIISGKELSMTYRMLIEVLGAFNLRNLIEFDAYDRNITLKGSIHFTR